MSAKPLKVVMIRRGTSKVSNVSSENLITFIRKKVLLGTDELSGDGKRWIRVDRHYQLREYFLDMEPGEMNLPPGLEGNLEELAGLLKDINDI